mgnify:CR=1 FL=1
MSKQRGLVDTNILIYAANSQSSYHLKAKSFLEKNLPLQNLVLTIQNLVEFYSLITNQKIFSKPFSENKAKDELRKIIDCGLYTIIIPNQNTPRTIMTLLEKYKTKGSEIHDVHLSAVMIDNNIDTIYTADTKIFLRLGLRVINPF